MIIDDVILIIDDVILRIDDVILGIYDVNLRIDDVNLRVGVGCACLKVSFLLRQLRVSCGNVAAHDVTSTPRGRTQRLHETLMRTKGPYRPH